ncbi:MAG: hypothetical protein PHP57_13400 [Sideroxydans sp.]|nr:hypothetical protein [Sideroxydans sp.]
MEYIGIGVGIVVAIISYLLTQKDKKQGEEIDYLKREVEQGKTNLVNLQLHIAGEHYKAQTIDYKFAQIDVSIKEGFREIREDIKALASEIHGGKGQ